MKHTFANLKKINEKNKKIKDTINNFQNEAHPCKLLKKYLLFVVNLRLIGNTASEYQATYISSWQLIRCFIRKNARACHVVYFRKSRVINLKIRQNIRGETPLKYVSSARYVTDESHLERYNSCDFHEAQSQSFYSSA